MRAVLRFILWTLAVLVVAAAAGYSYFIYTPDPAQPDLTGTLSNGTMESGERTRTYLTYVPKNLAKGAPLVVVMHGSGQNAKGMRVATGYGFERLADKHGFAVVYPEGFEGYWNACNIVGDYAANTLNIDDVLFLTTLVKKLEGELGTDPARVFATGLSRGGHMAYRLALEAPIEFRAVAAVAANVPAPDNFKCMPSGRNTTSVLIMNGTEDPLNPFNGGEVKLYGFINRGSVMSSGQSAEYFADMSGLGTSQPQTTSKDVADGISVERTLWSDIVPAEVELVAIKGGGHSVPQAAWRYPRILGPTAREPDGPEIIWDFFARQKPR